MFSQNSFTILARSMAVRTFSDVIVTCVFTNKKFNFKKEGFLLVGVVGSFFSLNIQLHVILSFLYKCFPQ